MPAKRTVKRTASLDLIPAVEEYLMNRSMRERATAIEDKLKKGFMDYLGSHGQLQSEGHRQVLFDQPFNFITYKKAGEPTDVRVYGLLRQKRVSQPLSEERALALVTELGLLERCTTTVVMLDEDAILAANFTGEITDDQLAALYDENETYAFLLITEEP